MRRTDLATGLRRLCLALLAAAALARPAAALTLEEETLFAGTPGGPVLTVLSTTDTAIFRPLIVAFQARRPDLTLRYQVAGSQEVFAAVHDGATRADLVISSAMDLQMKLANDGFAAPHRAAQTAALPPWARWRDQLFAVAQEPVVLIVDRAALGRLPVLRTRAALTALLRDHPERFRGRIGTYDPVRSGAGYLFATQDARQSDSFWRLAEVMGALSPRLYASSATMIADLQAGRLALAYNVLGSYAASSLPPSGDVQIVELQDFTHILLRTALIPRSAPSPDLAAAFLDFLLSGTGQQVMAQKAGLPAIDEAALAADQSLRPIRLDPGLMVYLDPLKRRRFLAEWSAALRQS